MKAGEIWLIGISFIDSRQLVLVGREVKENNTVSPGSDFCCLVVRRVVFFLL